MCDVNEHPCIYLNTLHATTRTVNIALSALFNTYRVKGGDLQICAFIAISFFPDIVQPSLVDSKELNVIPGQRLHFP